MFDVTSSVPTAGANDHAMLPLAAVAPETRTPKGPAPSSVVLELDADSESVGPAGGPTGGADPPPPDPQLMRVPQRPASAAATAIFRRIMVPPPRGRRDPSALR